MNLTPADMERLYVHQYVDAVDFIKAATRKR